MTWSSAAGEARRGESATDEADEPPARHDATTDGALLLRERHPHSRYRTHPFRRGRGLDATLGTVLPGRLGRRRPVSCLPICHRAPRRRG